MAVQEAKTQPMRRESDLFLNKKQLKELTGYVRLADQYRQLRGLGIPFKPGRDGVPLVLREVVETEFGLNRPSERRRSLPDLDGLRELSHGQT